MARIRTIKPEFFTSEDTCALSPLARLLYVGTWLEADREGRFRWNPKTLKTRYLPDDPCDALGVASELINRGLVVLYGDGLAYIPTFLEHQFINPRESKSKLPEPTREELARVVDACLRVQHAPSLPSIPLHSLPSQRSAPLIMSPIEHARKLEFCAFVGARLEVPKSLHGDLRKALGGVNADTELMAWYADLDEEIEASGESILPDVFKWMRTRLATWKHATNDKAKSFNDELDEWAKS